MSRIRNGTVPSSGRKPPWLKTRSAATEQYVSVGRALRRSGLHTVCQEARCPNQGECWDRGTATFLILGDICTRACRFCAVRSAKVGLAPDPGEPARLAGAVVKMGLEHVVITSVDRDDLPDLGAGAFAETIRAVRDALGPEAGIEVLVPDFQGRREAIQQVLQARPTVFAHNLEVVRSLTPRARDRRCSYDLSLEVLSVARELDREQLTKSSLMVGVGESDQEIEEAMEDLRGVGVNLLTLGQYLQPTRRHLAVEEYVTPERFEELGELARALGFAHVAAGPLVRSSYHAEEAGRFGRRVPGTPVGRPPGE